MQRLAGGIAVAVTVVLVAAGCRHGSEARVASLQARLAALEAEEQKVAALEARVAELEAADRLAGDLATRVGELVDHVDTLTRALEDVEAQIAAAEKAAALPARAPRRTGPDPNTVYSVPVGASPIEGPRVAKVTLVQAGEFACPFCKRVRPTIQQLIQDYGGDLRVVHKSFIVHPHTATVPAHAACAAHLQGRYRAMADAIWNEAFPARDFSEAKMLALADKLGLNKAQLRRDMNGPVCKKRVSDDQSLMQTLGVSGTPSFYINGRFLSGARPIGMFKTLIDEELKKANAAIASGTPVRDYYPHLVKTGKKTK